MSRLQGRLLLGSVPTYTYNVTSFTSSSPDLNGYWLACGFMMCLGTGSTLLVATLRGDIARHPYELDVLRIFCDFGLGVVIVVWGLSGYEQDPTNCLPYGICFQIFYVGSMLWFAVRAFDLHRAIKDPFSFASNYYKRYHVFVWIITSITVAVMIWPPNQAYADKGWSSLETEKRL